MEEHRLRPLLAPESVAVVGASPRAGTVSNGVCQNTRAKRVHG